MDSFAICKDLLLPNTIQKIQIQFSASARTYWGYVEKVQTASTSLEIKRIQLGAIKFLRESGARRDWYYELAMKIQTQDQSDVFIEAVRALGSGFDEQFPSGIKFALEVESSSERDAVLAILRKDGLKRAMIYDRQSFYRVGSRLTEESLREFLSGFSVPERLRNIFERYVDFKNKPPNFSLIRKISEGTDIEAYGGSIGLSVDRTPFSLRYRIGTIKAQTKLPYGKKADQGRLVVAQIMTDIFWSIAYLEKIHGKSLRIDILAQNIVSPGLFDLLPSLGFVFEKNPVKKHYRDRGLYSPDGAFFRLTLRRNEAELFKHFESSLLKAKLFKGSQAIAFREVAQNLYQLMAIEYLIERGFTDGYKRFGERLRHISSEIDLIRFERELDEFPDPGP